MVDSLDQKLRAAAARADFLEGRDPGEAGISDVVVASWLRSHAAGVDPDHPRSVYADDMDADSLLVRCARPVLQQLEVDTADVPLVVVLTDEKSRVVQRQGSSATVARLLDRVDLAPGFDYAESRMGTNGIGTAFAAGQPISVVGPEHYSENLQPFGCAGAPILSPVTGRVAGVIDITTMADAWNPLLKAVVNKAATDIGHNLMLDHGQAQHAVLDAYLKTVARSADQAVFAFGDSVSMANSVAQRLFSTDEQRVLREYVDSLMAGRESAGDAQVVAVGARLVNVRGAQVSTGSKVVGMVVIAEPVTTEQLRSPRASRVEQVRRIAASGGLRGAIGQHGTGHTWAPDRSLLRVDVINGRWTATRFRPDMTIDREVIGSEEAVHEQVNRWAVGAE